MDQSIFGLEREGLESEGLERERLERESLKGLFIVKLNLKVVTSEKIGESGVILTLGTWYGGVVMGVFFPFNEAAILYRDVNSAPSQKQNIIVFAANNSRCCECHVAPTIIL